MTTNQMRETLTYAAEEVILQGLSLAEIKNRKERHVNRRSELVTGYEDWDNKGRWVEVITDPVNATKYEARILAANDAINRLGN